MRKEEPIYLNGASKRDAPVRDRVGNITREFVSSVPSSGGIANVDFTERHAVAQTASVQSNPDSNLC